MNSLLLDRTTWDLVVDAQGNLAVASGSYAIGQDIASALRVFAGECYYNTNSGLPYRSHILGKMQSISVFRAQAETAARAIAGVTAARCLVAAPGVERRLNGSLVFTTEDGVTQSVGF